MWKHVLPPAVMVIAVWFSISIATSIYFSYAESSQKRILRENVTSIDTAGDLQATSWKVTSMLGDSKSMKELESVWMANRDLLHGSIQRLHEVSITEEEKKLLYEMDLHWEVIQQEMSRLSEVDRAVDSQVVVSSLSRTVAGALQRIGDAALQLRKHNGKLIAEEDLRQQLIRDRIMTARNTAVILGPLLGCFVGWRITSRLQRRLSTLAVTLRSAASNTVYTVGEYELKGGDNLVEVQRLSEKVINQFQRMTSELERAELEIVQSEKLAAVGEIAAGVAHELRNPLTSVKLLLQHAENRTESGMVEVENLRLILSEISRMENSIQGLLDFSRPSGLSCRIHDLAIPLQRAITLVSGRAISNRVQICFAPNDSPILVNGDIEQLHLVFVNLLINAVESMDQGGVISIEAFQSDAKQRVAVEVRDNGKGIMDSILPRLFEPFVTSKERGTGLGLALCHRIVTQHGGTIVAKNQSQGGAVFRVELPIATQSSASSQVA
ncbi:MAG: ATP-binding protein [Pirellulales bacterium]